MTDQQLLSNPERSGEFNRKLGDTRTSPPSDFVNASNSVLGKRPTGPSSLQKLLNLGNSDTVKRQKLEKEPNGDEFMTSPANSLLMSLLPGFQQPPKEQLKTTLDLTRESSVELKRQPQTLARESLIVDASSFSPRTFGVDTKYSHPVHVLTNQELEKNDSP